MTKACTPPNGYRIDGVRIRSHVPHIPAGVSVLFDSKPLTS
jgi:hypothetical protein